MKRIFCIFLSLILFMSVFMPVSAYAETYNLSDTDMSISVDDTMWYVFTRENIENNPELDELGITYETIHDILYSNEAYMDAILYHDSGEYMELFVRKRALEDSIVNLSDYDNESVLELAKELAKKQGAEEYSVYENRYKFAKMEYFDSNYNYYICEYVTCVNKDNYTLTFQSTFQFTEWEYEEIEKIVDSIIFDVDPGLKESAPASGFKIDLENVIVSAVIGGVGGGIIGALIYLISKKNKKHSGEE